MLVPNRSNDDPLNIGSLAGANDNVERAERLGLTAAFIQVGSRQNHYPGLVEPGSEQLQNILIRAIGQVVLTQHDRGANTSQSRPRILQRGAATQIERPIGHSSLHHLAIGF
jgi:hypothetical protein